MNRKNELIKQYKQNPPEMGIIKIQNKINGKIFLGKAHNLKGKLNRYKIELKNGTHHIKELQNDFNLYGEENFIFEVFDILQPNGEVKYDYTEDLKILEEIWLDKLQPYDEKGYNLKKKH